MTFLFSRHLATAGAAAALGLFSLGAQAAWPEKPIRIVVTFGPGGASDIVAREIATPLSVALGQPVIVDNKPGAGGTIGGSEVMRSAPDGYTLMLSNSTPLSIGPFTIPKLPYDPVKQFTHVEMLGSAPVLIMANPGAGMKSLKDVSKAVAAGGGHMSFGSGGPGSIGQIVGEMMKADMKLDMVHVPYRGGAPMSADLMAGTIPMGIDVITAYVPLVKAGSVTPLAVTSRTRSPLLPNVPTVVEAGYPDLLADNYFGVSGPAGMAPEVVARLGKALADIVASPAIARRFEELGIIPQPLRQAEFTAFVDRQIRDWAPAIKAADINGK
ncbi:MAG: tripartite tricarboxylate transporter substrate binding protein [Pseudomonadota bacterium]